MKIKSLQRVMPFVAAVVFFCCSDSITVPDYVDFDTTHKGVVYLVPCGVSDPSLWHDTYGDRLFFYQHEDLNDFSDEIHADFSRISSVYNTVIIFLPHDTSARYRNNVAFLNTAAAAYSLSLLLNILPDEDYYRETSYLTTGSSRNLEVLSNMEYFEGLSQVWKVALWYGWNNRKKPMDVINFYNSLSEDLKAVYACWLDEEFAAAMKNLANIGGEDFLVITEWYQRSGMKKISSLFPRQMIITGYEGAVDFTDWNTNIPSFLDNIRGSQRQLGIWMYYDIGDGSGEEYHVYFPAEDKIAAPWDYFIE